MLRLFLSFILTPELRKEVVAWQEQLARQEPFLSALVNGRVGGGVQRSCTKIYERGVTLGQSLRRDVAQSGKCSELRRTPAENLHATLLFLGSVPESKLLQLKVELVKVAAHYPPIVLELRGLEVIPNRRRPRVLALMLKDQSDGDFRRLQNDLFMEIKKLDVTPTPPKPPHLTLARFPREFRGRFESELPKKQFSFWRNDSFQLVKSELTPRGPIYTRLEAYSLL